MRLIPCPSCSRHLFANERACPHCKVGGSTFLLGVAAILAACGSDAPPESVSAVYGPAAVESARRVPSASSTASAAVTQPPPQVEVDVYGPPPVDPSTRTPSLSTSGSASSVPAPPPPGAKVYGPPPRDPDQRLPKK